jgi:hypothetical protein
MAMLVIGSHPSLAGFCSCGCASSPLILDLGKTGFIVTTDVANGVRFDLDSDGFIERRGWTYFASPYGFLFLDQNGNGRVDNGRELFGNATLLPDGTTADNGFEALAVYNRSEFGGNEDAFITPEDSIWPSLRLWIDWSHDGITDPDEVSTLDAWSIVRIGLTYKQTPFVDGVGNSHKLKGSFWREKKVLGVVIPIEQLMEDVFFVFDSEGIEQDLIFTDGFESGDVLRWSESCEGVCP